MIAHLLQLSNPLETLPDRQRITALLLAFAVLAVVFELVRRRRLREEYSWLWVGTAVLLIALALEQDLVVEFSRWIGAASVTSTLFFGCLLFLLALSLQFSVRLSRLTLRNKTLAQRLALLELELERLRGKPLDAGDGATPLRPPPLPMRRPVESKSASGDGAG